MWPLRCPHQEGPAVSILDTLRFETVVPNISHESLSAAYSELLLKHDQFQFLKM